MRISMIVRFQASTVRRSVPLVALACGLVGCGGPAPEAPTGPAPVAQAPATADAKDPDDVPITEANVSRPKDYAEAVARIVGYRDAIRDEIAAGRPTKAHRALDELDIVLNWLPGIARDSGVPKDSWEAVNTTAQSIRDLFNQVHSRIDARQEPDYGAVAGAIEQAIGSLKAIPATSGSSGPAVRP